MAQLLLPIGLLLAATAGAGVVTNLARLPGVMAVADSECRERWGLDGFHAANAIDGHTGGIGEAARTGTWASDNWETTHALALVFPRQVRIQQVVVHWAKPTAAWLTPPRYVLGAFRDGSWATLADVRDAKAEASSSHASAAVVADALRIVLPPGGAHPAADRRLWIAEIEVLGEPVEPPRPVDTGAVKSRLVAELTALRRQEDAARVAPALDVAMRTRKTQGFQAIVDREDLARGRHNVATLPWAKTFVESVTTDADWWLEQSDESIYRLIPAGNPRALCPQFEKGCPIHGGARGSFTATIEKPFVWKCTKGGEEWFDGATVRNPGSGESVTVHDDGSGWLAPPGFPNAGRRYFFVAAYRYFLLGKLFNTPYEGDGGSAYKGATPVRQLALAYALTGDPRYAHKCAVMLNRLAEVYRTYDGSVEGPSQRQDGYIGQTFERFLAQELVLACDLIWDTIEGDEALHRFFGTKGNTDYDGDGKVTGADFAYNLQRNLLGYVYEYLHRLMPYMDGDFIMYEMTALAALGATLGNADIVAEALESDLGLRVMLANSWFRDGKFVYDSCGYNVGNARTPLLTAEWLHGFRAPPRYPQPLDLYHAPDYRMSMLLDFLRDIDGDGRLPQIGDGGGARTCQLRRGPAYDGLDERALVRLPEQREFYLKRLVAAARGDLDAFRSGKADWWLVFHGESLPKSAAPPGEQPAAASHLFPDGGIAVLRAGADAATRQHVCLTFSKGNYGHGHADKLAINLIRYGYDLSADLGYPTTWTDAKYSGWETHTASHCTVMLDAAPQQHNVIGDLHWFANLGALDAVEASAERAYPQASLYRRTLALVRDGQGEPLYTVDVFRVAGAGTRDYLFHSMVKPEQLQVTAAGQPLAWARQASGSLAGETVEPMTQGGYGFLADVSRASTDRTVTARWLSATGQSQPDRYLLTRRGFREFTAEFVMVRTGQASGSKERACFVFEVDPANQGNRRCAWLDPGGQLPVGKPVSVRVEVSGAAAHVSRDGKPTDRSVDAAGKPRAGGVAGFLHYYNYAYDYRDLIITPKGEAPVRIDLAQPLAPEFWGRIDATYAAAGGLLQVRDSETVGLDLHLLGTPGREIIRASGEGYGLRGKSPLEGHFIARDRVADPAARTSFVAVIEAHRGQGRVQSVTRLAVRPAGPAPRAPIADSARAGSDDVVALRVRTPEGDDVILSCLSGGERVAADTPAGLLEFSGRFGFARLAGGQVRRLGLVGDGSLAVGSRRLASECDLVGRIRGIDLEANALVIESDKPSWQPPADVARLHLVVRNPAFVCPAVYPITGCTAVKPGHWRVQVAMPFVLARGVVASVDAGAGAFATRTPVMKLRVNPRLFDGKYVRPRCGSDAPAYVLRTATETAFVLGDKAALRDFRAGGEYLVCDVGVGDRVEVASACEQEF